VRTAYLGTSDFAATVLRRLAESAHAPALVVTPPDRRKGRGRRELPPPAAELAAELGLDLLQTENVNEAGALERIRAARPEAVVVCAFGQLIREPLLSELPMLNVHPSLLPRWRGAAPIERAIMAGDARTGVCIMRLTAGLDSGPVALREEIEIGAEEDFAELSTRLAALSGELLVRALDLQAAGELEFAEQDEVAATYAEKIETAERRLDAARPAAELAAKVRALTPHIGAYLETAEGERLGIRRASVFLEEAASDVGNSERATYGRGVTETRPVPPGEGEIAVADGQLLLGCGEGTLRLEVIQPPGGKPMPAEDYLRGHAPPALA
jgi:methionyl-tRNA formyltransferase